MKLELNPINILIGSNGSGKSNFISFFKLVNSIFNQNLQQYVIQENTDSILYFGRRMSDFMKGKLIISQDGSSNNAYNFQLHRTLQSGLYLDFEGSGFDVSRENNSNNYFYNNNLYESDFAINTTYKRNRILSAYIKELQVFHFHDTSSTSLLRNSSDVNNNSNLKSDGRNLSAFLYFLKQMHFKLYERIVKTIQSIAPYISELILQPNKLNSNEIELRWVDIGDIESNFSAYQLSDGTLRFIALATLLMQPEPPAVIIIDEPELGLHPFAIGKLAAMIQASSSETQIIVATQSPGLISHFTPEDIIVVDKNEEEKQSTFNRLKFNDLSEWLNEYSLGDLWERNIINSAQPFPK